VWIKTQSGGLVNLDDCRAMYVERDDDGEHSWLLIAFFGWLVEDGRTTRDYDELGEFATHAEAVEVLARIAKTLPCRDVAMPPRPESKATPPGGEGKAERRTPIHAEDVELTEEGAKLFAASPPRSRALQAARERLVEACKNTAATLAIGVEDHRPACDCSTCFMIRDLRDAIAGAELQPTPESKPPNDHTCPF
jgi:hypothetical protein